MKHVFTVYYLVLAVRRLKSSASLLIDSADKLLMQDEQHQVKYGCNHTM